jgi:hypothetical protein
VVSGEWSVKFYGQWSLFRSHSANRYTEKSATRSLDHRREADTEAFCINKEERTVLSGLTINSRLHEKLLHEPPYGGE